MTTRHRLFDPRFLIVGAVFAGALIAAPAHAIDWGSVTGKDIVLFYPGQASWEWALTQSDHSGAKKFREGKNCIECHGGEEKDIGNLIVSGKKLEPSPIAGKRGSISVNVKAAHDGERLFVRLEWPEAETSADAKMDPDFEVKATMIIDDGSVVESKRAGCWGACHDDATRMASAPDNVKITKYLTRSRTKVTRQGGGETYKPAGELGQLISEGVFLEYWQAKLNKGAEAVAADGYILDKRHRSETPLVDVKAEFANGMWSVVLSRKMSVDGQARKTISDGNTYYVGFAIHEGHTEYRFHHVSFEHTLAVGQGNADIVAVRK